MNENEWKHFKACRKMFGPSCIYLNWKGFCRNYETSTMKAHFKLHFEFFLKLLVAWSIHSEKTILTNNLIKK